MIDSVAIILQINLKDIGKGQLRLTAHHIGTAYFSTHQNLKLIGEELWHCHRDGITVYDCQWNKLREIRLDRWAISVAELDTKTVVIATYRGLVISSTSGTCMNVRVVKVCIFCNVHILKTWNPTF